MMIMGQIQGCVLKWMYVYASHKNYSQAWFDLVVCPISKTE